MHDFENVGQYHDVQLSQWATFDGKYPPFYLMSTVMFHLSLTVNEIFVNQEKIQNLILKLEIKVKKLKNATCAIRLEIFDSIKVIFFSELMLPGHIRLRKR